MPKKNYTKPLAKEIAQEVSRSAASGSQKGRAGHPRTNRGKKEQIAHDMAYAWQQRLKNKTLQEIAAEIGVSSPTVAHYLRVIADEMHALAFEKAEQWRALELERLDRLEQRLQAKIDAGDVSAIHAALRISERRGALLQLGTVQHDHQVIVRIVDEVSQ